jgi:hypothetical protein
MVLALALLLQLDQTRIDDAIRKGVEFLKTAESPGQFHIAHADELLLYTFAVAGVPASDARFRSLLDRVLREPPTHTYRVALQAMALEELDRAAYQDRIARCAQHLVDNQCLNGQWSYGEAATPRRDDGVASGGGRGALRRLVVRAQRTGPADGDNSNSQYAALGLRACHDAGIVIPEGTIRRADRWWESTITAGGKKPERPAIASGGGETPQGWGYKRGEDPYNTMTAGGVGGLVIYDALQKRDWRKNPQVKNGLAWMAGHYWADQPPRGLTPFWYFYYLYAVERVGMLFDTPMIGRKDWYFDGATWLLAQQAANGSWDQNRLYANPSTPTYDTCFAILFLKKATKRLVASGEKK